MPHHPQPKDGALLSLANWVAPREDEAFLSEVSGDMRELAGAADAARPEARQPSLGELLRRRGQEQPQARLDLPALPGQLTLREMIARRETAERAAEQAPGPRAMVFRAGTGARQAERRSLMSRIGSLFSRGDRAKRTTRGRDESTDPIPTLELAAEHEANIPALADDTMTRQTIPAAQPPQDAEEPLNASAVMAGYFANLGTEREPAQAERPMAPAANRSAQRMPPPRFSAPAAPPPPQPYWPPAPQAYAPPYPPAAPVYPNLLPPHPAYPPQPASAHFYWPVPAAPHPAMPGWPDPAAPGYPAPQAAYPVEPGQPMPAHQAAAAHAYGPMAAEDVAAEIDEVRERLRDFAELLRELREMRRTG